MHQAIGPNHEKYGEVLFRLRSAKADLQINDRRQHVCSKAVCNPENEPALCGQDAFSCNIFLCKFGAVHVCTEDLCDMYRHAHDATCSISGIQWGTVTSQYVRTDSKTWNTKAEVEVAPRKTQTTRRAGRIRGGIRKPVTDVTLVTNATNIVMQLLFSDVRRQVNLNAIQENQMYARKAAQTYINNRLRLKQLPYMSDIYRLMASFTLRALPLVEYEVDHNIANYYAEVVMQLWKKLGSEGDFETVCLATLYALRTGISNGPHDLLPRDDFLLCNLPQLNTIELYGYKRDKITKGFNRIQSWYADAIRQGVALEDIKLDVTQLPAKNAGVYNVYKL